MNVRSCRRRARCAPVLLLSLVLSARGTGVVLSARARAPRSALLLGEGPPRAPSVPSESSPERQTARLAMLGAAMCFGACAPAIKEVYTLPGPPSASALSCARGLLIALPLLPKLWERGAEGAPLLNRRCLGAAAELALYSFALTTLLNVGLAQGGSATKASFLLQAAVVFTPCLSLAAREPVAGRTWLGALMALLGVALIALEEGGSTGFGLRSLVRFEGPDLLFLGCSLCWALIIFRLGAFARCEELADKVLTVQAAKNAMLAVAFSAWLGLDTLRTGGGLGAQWPGAGSPLVWVFVLASALFGGLLGDLLQAVGGRAMPAAEANVILTSEPLWNAGLTAALLGESFGLGLYAGGALLIGAGVVSTVEPPSAEAREGLARGAAAGGVALRLESSRRSSAGIRQKARRTGR